MPTHTAPKLVGPRDGKAGTLGSIGVRFMIDTEETHAGGFSLVEHPMPPRALAELTTGLAAGFDRPDARALVALALDFWTWQRLDREGLDDVAAAELMTRAVG